MDTETVRRIDALEKRLDGLVLPEKSLLLAAPFLQLPVLRGLWISSVDNNGDWFDLSGLGHTLNYNGNPTFSYDGPAPFWMLDGTGDYFNITDAASGNNFDILGTETYVRAVARGLTILGWFYSADVSVNQGLVTKFLAAGNQRAYWLELSGSQAAARMSNAGVAADAAIASGTNLTSNQWFFAGLRFEPSTALTVFQDSLSAQDAVGVPASIFNSSADLVVGGFSGGATLLTGRAIAVAVCAAAASNAMVGSIFQQTRAIFGI